MTNEESAWKRMFKALSVARDQSMAEEGHLGEKVEEGHPPGAVPGESPIMKQIREARELAERLNRKQEVGEGKPPVK
jgi:hypothetical protein